MVFGSDRGRSDEFAMLLGRLSQWEKGELDSRAPEGSGSLCLDFEKINYDNLSLCEKTIKLTSGGKLVGKCLIRRTSHCVMVLLSD